MNWDNIRFTGRDMIMILANVVTATSFVLIMKTDIRTLVSGQQRMEAIQKEQQDEDKAFRAKSEAEWTEMKVRVSILEQKVTNLQIEFDAKRY
ncbi:hypothetical protein SAMN05428988_0170 [Chitinophaga sp. YR573]|uniref:hypothetical protein n=1 Tax=Chitinophaga sp. YR573 TaxID=1881040 RepID=UPI0008CDFA2B|nr:hypothetical protein [Chitinophaga sp. YR573]SEV89045.1 hypothetical protein SAMN05428988_0170 [Chitinophaga sp. YR573]